MTDTTTPTPTPTRRVARMCDERGYHVFTVPGPWHDVDEIAQANRRAGGHWFDADAKRFFRSRCDGPVIGGRLFVSSEKGPDERRLYTIRVALDDGSITDLDGFQRYGTRKAAETAARTAVLHATVIPAGPVDVDELDELRLGLERLCHLLQDIEEPPADIDRPAAGARADLLAAANVVRHLVDAGRSGRGPFGGPIGRHLFDAATVAEEV